MWLPVTKGSDGADQLETRHERRLAGLPRNWADLAVVLADVLRGFDAAQELRDRPADRVVMDLERLDDTVGIDDEAASTGDAVSLDVDAELARERAGRICDERVTDLGHGRRGVVPRLVDPDGVGADRGNLRARLAEGVVEPGRLAQLGRADEGEVARIEQECEPAAAVLGDAERANLALVEGVQDRRRDALADADHRMGTSWRTGSVGPVGGGCAPRPSVATDARPPVD